jgi:hypothetical protein
MFLRKAFLPVMFFASLAVGKSQDPDPSYSPEDHRILEELLRDLDSVPAGPFGKTAVAVGELFLGTPYVANTLESEGAERLVVNLRGLDCTTFVENVVVIARMKYEGNRDWETYLRKLEQIRYREGRLQGYPSRLHYFTDWIRDNQQKGLVSDITREMGGVRITREINFMGTHPERYPALSAEKQLEQIRAIEAGLSAKPLFVLPVEELALQEGLLRDGDIVALATDIEGLDVTHTGIAITGGDGRIHLLHASTDGAVTITKEPLTDYLKKISRNTGVMVVRPLEPAN